MAFQLNGVTSYLQHAWVNFNGAGTVSIRGDQGVTTIGDNSTGNYTVNFALTLGDINYCTHLSASDAGTTGGQSNGYAYGSWLRGSSSVAYGTTSMRINTGYPANSSSYDQSHINLSCTKNNP